MIMWATNKDDKLVGLAVLCNIYEVYNLAHCRDYSHVRTYVRTITMCATYNISYVVLVKYDS